MTQTPSLIRCATLLIVLSTSARLTAVSGICLATAASLASAEEANAVVGLGLGDAVEGDRNQEEGQATTGSKAQVEVVDRTEEQLAEATGAHQRSDAEHGDRQQQRRLPRNRAWGHEGALVEDAADGRGSQANARISKRRAEEALQHRRRRLSRIEYEGSDADSERIRGAGTAGESW